MKDSKRIINFIDYAERLKVELRHASKSDSQRESVADHSWRLSLMLMLVAPKIKLKIDLQRALKMALIHDIVEIEAKDVPAIEHIGNQKLSQDKEKKEQLAIRKIKKMLGGDGQEIFDLWQEYEKLETNESKVVKALDKLEGELQFLQDPIRKFTLEEQGSIKLLLDRTSKLCAVDPFLHQLDKITFPDLKKRTLPD